MKVKMITTMAGPSGVVVGGVVVDIPEDEAFRLVRGGFAERVDVPTEEQKEEFAESVPDSEFADERSSKKRAKRG